MRLGRYNGPITIGGGGEGGKGQEAVYAMPARNYSKISVDKAKTIKRKKYNNSTELKHLH